MCLRYQIILLQVASKVSIFFSFLDFQDQVRNFRSDFVNRDQQQDPFPQPGVNFINILRRSQKR